MEICIRDSDLRKLLASVNDWTDSLSQPLFSLFFLNLNTIAFIYTWSLFHMYSVIAQQWPTVMELNRVWNAMIVTEAR